MDVCVFEFEHLIEIVVSLSFLQVQRVLLMRRKACQHLIEDVIVPLWFGLWINMHTEKSHPDTCAHTLLSSLNLLWLKRTHIMPLTEKHIFEGYSKDVWPDESDHEESLGLHLYICLFLSVGYSCLSFKTIQMYITVIRATVCEHLILP